LGFAQTDTIALERAPKAQLLRGKNGAVATWIVEGHQSLEKTEEFFGRRDLNVIHARSAVNTLRAAPVPRVLASLHYASPKPLSFRDLQILVGPTPGLPK
jgi:hypothetical protein